MDREDMEGGEQKAGLAYVKKVFTSDFTCGLTS